MRLLRYFFIFAAFSFVAISNVFAQTPQRLVLWEEFTQWNCPPCGAINPVLEPMIQSQYKNVISIWYHGNFPDANDDPMYLFDQTDHQGRYDYYSVNSEPQARIDGNVYTPSGSYAGSPQDTAYDQRILATEKATATPLTLAITETPDGLGGTNVQVVATSTSALSGNYTLRVAVVNAEVDTLDEGSPYRNPEVSFINVVQAMLPDYNGKSISLQANTPQTYNFNYNPGNIMPTGNIPKIFIVAWVQNDVNHAVINAATDFYDAGTSVLAPTITIGDPGKTLSTNTATLTNSSQSPMTVFTSLTSNAPSTWTVNYSVGEQSSEQTYTDTNTTIVPPGGSVSFAVKFVAPNPGGTAIAQLQVTEAIQDTSYKQIGLYYSATNDLNTLIMDMTGQTTRASVYYDALASNTSNKFAYGVLPEEVLFPNGSYIGTTAFPSLKNIICVAGAGYFGGGSLYYFSPYDYFTPLETFMSGGGNVFFTDEVVYALAQNNNYTVGTGFFTNWMHAMDNVETGTLHGLVGVTGDPVSNGVSCLNEATIHFDQTNVQYFNPDAMKPVDAEATPIFNFATNGKPISGDSSICGVRVYDPVAGYKAVYMTYTMEAMASSSARTKLMNNIITWFSSPAAVWEQPEPTAVNSNLMTNYPNPFDGTTAIQFNLPQDEHVTINVYDMKGALVSSVADGEMHSGANTVNFDGANLPAGVYEYRLAAPSGIMTGLMSLVKE